MFPRGVRCLAVVLLLFEFVDGAVPEPAAAYALARGWIVPASASPWEAADARHGPHGVIRALGS
jgi:hypothetical protein